MNGLKNRGKFLRSSSPEDDLIETIPLPFVSLFRFDFFWRCLFPFIPYINDSDPVTQCGMLGDNLQLFAEIKNIDSLMKGADYSELKESYVIFICLSDPFNDNLPIYTFERKCKEKESVELKDETHHLIFNCAAYEEEENPELKEFLSFVKNNKANSDLTRRIENMVQTKKFEQSFVNEYMAWNLHDQDVLKRGREEGRKEGQKEGIFETYFDLIKSGLISIKDAAAKLNMSESALKESFNIA